MMTDIEKAGLLLTSFPGRSDCHGASGEVCIKGPLTMSVILRHILGKQRIGRYLLRVDGKIGVLAVDMDDSNLYSAVEYCGRCHQYQLATHIERSKSKGYHLWWFFSEFVSAQKARLVANYILDECELLHMAEVFPKRDILQPDRYGNFINLPEFGRDVKRGRTVFLNPRSGHRPYGDQWAFLASVEKISEAQLDDVIELNGLAAQPSLELRMENGEATDFDGTGLPCFTTMMREGVKEGMRNEAALRLSVSLYRTGIPMDLGLLVMREWNLRNQPPLDDNELEKAVSNGYLGVYGYGCFSKLVQRFCDPTCPVFRKHNIQGALRDGLRRRSDHGRRS